MTNNYVLFLHFFAEFAIEVYTGKQKMSGTDANVFITLFGEHGASKKIHLVDPSSNKKCFEKNSVDNFRVQMYSIGELRRIRYGSEGTSKLLNFRKPGNLC